MDYSAYKDITVVTFFHYLIHKAPFHAMRTMQLKDVICKRKNICVRNKSMRNICLALRVRENGKINKKYMSQRRNALVTSIRPFIIGSMNESLCAKM